MSAMVKSSASDRLQERRLALEDLQDGGMLDDIDPVHADLHFGRLIREARDRHFSDEHMLTQEYLMLEKADIVAEQLRGREAGWLHRRSWSSAFRECSLWDPIA